MTLENLLQALLKLTPQQRQMDLVLFDYKTGKFIELNELSICMEGEPEFHLTIN